MSTTLDFYYDFGSPNGYFAWKVLQDMSKRLGIEVVMHPVLLGGVFKLTGNQAPWQAFANVKHKLAYEQLEIQRFIQDHQLTDFTFNSAFPVMTLLAMRGAMAAQKADVHETYYPAVYKAMWEDDKNISEPEVLAKVLTEAGLDGVELVSATQDSEVKQALMDATQAAVDRGIFGIPTFFLGDDMYFGKERLIQIEQALGG